MIKSVTAQHIFYGASSEKEIVGRWIWSDGFFASTVGKHEDEQMIFKYVKNHGKIYKPTHQNYQIELDFGLD